MAVNCSFAIAVLAALVATPASAQSLGEGISGPAFDMRGLSASPPSGKEPAISLRMIEQLERDGSTTRRRELSLGREIAPNVTVGVGLFNLKPRKSALSPEPQLDSAGRKSRKAAVRLTFDF